MKKLSNNKILFKILNATDSDEIQELVLLLNEKFSKEQITEIKVMLNNVNQDTNLTYENVNNIKSFINFID